MPPSEPATDDARQVALEMVHRYHDGTKHTFARFARSLGYLDWAAQPRVFRTFPGARCFPLYPAPGAFPDGYVPRPVSLDEACSLAVEPAPLTAGAIGDLLRHALGLSAWKAFGASRWSLRVTPSSGNLHPTEAYVVLPPLPGLADSPGVYHYDVERHAVELRCAFDGAAWERLVGDRRDVMFVALTSIHWREAWKYGERAFRYCQHDLGHTIASLSVAAAVQGWQVRIVPALSHDALAALTGVGRDSDFIEAEREEPGCLLAIAAGPVPEWTDARPFEPFVDAVAGGAWSGRASQLSEDHVTWTFVDEVAQATVDPGRPQPVPPPTSQRPGPPARDRRHDARALLLSRRSAVAFDGRAPLDRGAFVDILARLMPGDASPWTSLWWSPRVHLALFVHRVEGMPPGLYMLPRTHDAQQRLRDACHADFLWEPAADDLPLWLLKSGDARTVAQRLSCDQHLAGDGHFSLGMLVDFGESLQAFGPSFYRQLFWEAGMVGQVLYLQAEASGVRGTGIGCFFDDPVHDLLGLHGHAFQSLYHFAVGRPLDDSRLTSEPGYAWEHPAS